MADITFSTANTAGFIPTIWAQRALMVLRNNIELAPHVMTDTDWGAGDFATQGQTLTIPYPGTFTAVQKAAGTPVTPQAPSGGASVNLSLTRHTVVPFLVEDFADAQANMDLMDRYLQPATIAVVEQFETDLFSLYQGVATTIGTPGTGITASLLRQARAIMLAQKAPKPWSIVLSPTDEESILGDSTLQTYFAYAAAQAKQQGNAQDALPFGKIGSLYGFDIYVSQLVPDVAQSVWTITSTATGGTFTVTYNGQTTSAQAYNVSTANLQTALQGLSSIGTGNVTVTGSAGTSYVLTFTGTLANTQTAPTIGTGSLTGGTASIAQSGTMSNKNLAFSNQSFMYATRPFRPAPASAGVMSAVAVDPPSGLSVRISAQYDINNMGMRVNLDMLYGYANLRPTLGVVLLS